MVVCKSEGRRSRACWQLNSADRSHGTDHWAKCMRNKSFQDSWSNKSWSCLLSVWNGAKHRTHRTAMNSNRAAVSCKILKWTSVWPSEIWSLKTRRPVKILLYCCLRQNHSVVCVYFFVFFCLCFLIWFYETVRWTSTSECKF